MLSCRDPEGAMKNLSHFGHLRLAGMVWAVCGDEVQNVVFTSCSLVKLNQ